MRLGKRFVAWFLTGVMVVSSVQLPVGSVQAEEIRTEVDESTFETENVENELSEEEHKEMITSDNTVESDGQEWKDETGSDIVKVQEVAEGTVILSGNCGENGDNVTFVLDGDGLLTISGSGRMKNYSCDGAPWYEKRGLVKTIVVNEGVESIGEFAFYTCSDLKSVSISKGVKSIGDSAFELCSSLTSVDIPEGVTSISSAFAQCSNLKSVSIPQGVENIECAFWQCSNLADVSIPEGVVNMDYAFYCCKSLKNVSISKGVTKIGESTFDGCSSLSNINIPDSVTIIEQWAFMNCDSLQDVYYGGSEDDWKGISIEEKNSAIENAVIHYNSTTNLTSLSNASIMLSQESYTYDGLAKKPSVYVTLNGKTLTKDVDYTVSYSNNINVGTATVTITGIGDYTDSVIRKFTIEEKTVEKNEISLGDYIYLGSYYNQPILWRCVDKDENGLLMLSDRILCFKAYDACGEDDYYHNDSWGYVRKQYGSNCWEDSSIRQWLNSNSDTVNYSHCPPSAERVYDGYNPYDTESGFLNNFSADEQKCIKQVTQVINVNECEADRDGYCDGGFEEIDCRLIYDYPLDTDYTSFFYKRCSDKIFLMNARQIRRVYNNFEDYIYAYPTEDAVQNNDEKSSEITSSMTCQYSLNVPGTIGASFEHVETVPANQLNPKGAYASSGIRPAFYLNESLFSGEVFKEKPSNNNTIINGAVELSQESYVYDGLEKKPSVRVNLNGKTLTPNIDYTVTYSNNINVGIATVTITGIGNYTGIVIKEFTIEEIKTSGSCGDNLTWKISGANNKLILTISGTGTMTDYSSLKEVPWHNRASSITSLVIEDGVTSIGDNAFADFTAIKNVEIPESVTTIGYSAFANMDNVEGIVITDGVTSIGDRSFYSCDKLSYVEIAGSVTSVGSSAFNACDSLKEVVFCGDAPEIGADCFSNTSDLSIYYPETAAGWDLNIQQPYDLCKWQKWDNTVPTRDIVLLLDVSGSMEDKTDKLKDAVKSFIDAMGGRLKNTRVALVPYNSSASVLSELTTNKGYLATLVNGLAADGGTYYIKALNSADAILQSSNARQKAIVMFSDGEPKDTKTTIYTLSEKLRESYIIYTVGLVDSSSCSDVLKKVAGSDGRYFEADNIDNLIDAFLNVADEMDSTIKDFSIDQTAIGSVNGLVRISGSISLTDDSKLSETVLDSKIKSIQWTSSDQDIVQDSEISCVRINSYDNRSAELMISFTPHKEGKVMITGTSSNGLTASCEVTIEEDGTDSDIVSDRNSITIDGYTIYVTDTSGKPIYNASVVIGTNLNVTDKNGKAQFSSIKGLVSEDGSLTFNITVQAGGYSKYTGYDCAVNDNHITYITMLTIGEADDSNGVNLLKNDCFESVLFKDALFGNIDLLVNQKTISLSEPDSIFNLTVNVKDSVKEYVKKYYILSGNKRIAESDTGQFSDIKHSLFEADKKVYILLDIDQGEGEVKRAATQRQQINLFVKNPGDIIKDSYGSLNIGENLTFTVSDSIPFVGGSKFNLAQLDLPINMKFSTDGSFVLTINTDDEALIEKNELLFKDYDKELAKTNDLLDERIFGAYKNAVAKSTENLKNGKEDESFKDFELKFSDDFKFTAQIGGSITGKLNDSVKKGTGKLFILAKAEYKSESSIILYTVPITISMEVKAEGKATATINADFSDVSKSIADSISGDLLFSLTPSVKVGAGPGCKELNVKINGGFSLPIDYYMIGDKQGLQSIALQANASISGKVFCFEKEWEFWKGELKIYSRPEGAEKDIIALSEEHLINAVSDLSNLQTVDYSVVARGSSWNAVPVESKGRSQVLNNAVSTYADTKTVVAGDSVLMVYKDVDTTRDAYNADVLYYSIYNKSSAVWSEPRQVDSNSTADFDFDLYSDGENIYLAYQEMNRKLLSTDTVEDMTKATRISFVRFDKDVEAFVDFEILADNGNYVSLPSVVANGAIVTVSWIENSSTDYYGLNNTNAIVTKSFEEGKWSGATTLQSNSTKICEIQGCVLGGKTYIAYIVDKDNDLATTADRDVLLTDLNRNLLNVTEDDVLNANLVYCQMKDTAALYWYHDNTIVMIDSAGSNMTELVGGLEINPNESFTVVSDREMQAVLFTQNDMSLENEIVEAYVMYRQSDGTYTLPVQVTEDKSYISGFSGVMADGKVLLNYRQDTYKYGDSIDISSKLCTMLIEDFSKLSIDDLDYDYDAMKAGSSLVMTADITNRSNHRITMLDMAVTSPSNKKIDEKQISVELGVGETKTVPISVEIPKTLEKGKYELEISESNVAGAYPAKESFQLLYADLNLLANVVTLGENTFISAVIENRGDLSTAATIMVVNNDDTEQILFSSSVDEIESYSYQTVQIPITESMLTKGSIYSDFTVSVVADKEDIYQYNNSVLVQVESCVRSMAFEQEHYEMYIGEKKALSVIIDAIGTPKFQYEWQSSDDSIARVDEKGTVTALEEGEVTITVMTKQGDYAECKVTVSAEDSRGVLPEDIPADGKIPEGLWIAGIKTYTYTGKPIKPEVRVYDSDKLLKEGQDYTISYKNNTKANDASKESTAPAVVVKGKGNYTGTEKETFKILPLDLNDTSIIAEDITVAYNNKMQKKVPIVTYNGKKLANNKDFTVSYPDKRADAYKGAGTYSILLTAKQGGNFTGTRTVKFIITNNTLISGAAVKKIANQTYTGKAIEPELEVTMKKAPLVKNKDYTVTYVNNIESGTATAILTGIGEYAGTKKVTFKIIGTPLKGAVVSGITDKVYSGTEQQQKITVTLNNKILKEKTDYEVIYSQNTNVGKATVTIKGIKAYSGTIKKTFKITAYDMKENAGSRIGGLGKEITAKYLKGGSKPKLELTFAGKKLIEGTDYTVSYQNNKAVTMADTKNMPTVTIKGKGNFKGTLTKTFTITGKALNDTEFPVTLTVADKGFVDKAGKYISVPVLTDADGMKLAAGKDYESTVVYTLEDGTELTKNSKVNAGTKVKVKVTGKSAYTGELEGVYQITQNDFNKAKISISPQTYTGKAVTLDKDSVTVKIGKETLTFGKDYEIVENSYANNIEKGTASVTIIGKGNYGGTKTVKFKITARKLSWFWRLFG